MSAILEAFLQKTAKLFDEVTRPFSQSRKIYVSHSRADICIKESNDPHYVKLLRQ
jgi:phosphomethylpyrimidine synthase